MISFHNLTLAWPTQNLLKDVSGHFARGEIIGILGPNGSGKTTFLKALAGLVLPVQGQVLLKNKPFEAYTWAHLAQIRRFTPATFSCSWPLSVEEVLSLGQPEEHVMDSLSIDAFRHKKFSELSTGEKARVMLTLNWPISLKILFLDEYFAHLDSNFRSKVIKMMVDFVKKGGTVMISFQEKELACAVCSQILYIENQKLVTYKENG